MYQRGVEKDVSPPVHTREESFLEDEDALLNEVDENDDEDVEEQESDEFEEVSWFCVQNILVTEI